MVELFGRNSRNHVCRKDGAAYKPKNTVPTVEFGGGSIMVFGVYFVQNVLATYQ